MCLNTKTSVYSVAENDIKCYKVLLLCDGEFMTPYQKTPIRKIVVDGKTPFFADGEKSIKGMDYNSDNTSVYDAFSNKYVIGNGFIHTYKSLTSAWYLKNHIEFIHPKYVCCIFECEIPKGAKYYEGEDDFYEVAFASEKIKFIKEIKIDVHEQIMMNIDVISGIHF